MLQFPLFIQTLPLSILSLLTLIFCHIPQPLHIYSLSFMSQHSFLFLQWPSTTGLTRYGPQWSVVSVWCSCWPSACGRGAGSFLGTVWETWRPSSLPPHLGFWEALAPGACAPWMSGCRSPCQRSARWMTFPQAGFSLSVLLQMQSLPVSLQSSAAHVQLISHHPDTREVCAGLKCCSRNIETTSHTNIHPGKGQLTYPFVVCAASLLSILPPFLPLLHGLRD